jgi:hypothetical protein
MSLTICTYDLGKNIENYRQPSQEKTAEILSGRADVYLFQGAGSENRVFLKKFKEDKNYLIFYPDMMKTFKTAIVLNRSRFEKITNYSYGNEPAGDDISIVTATDTQTKQTIGFISVCDLKSCVFDNSSWLLSALKAKEFVDCQLEIIGVTSNLTTCSVHDSTDEPDKLEKKLNAFVEAGYEVVRRSTATKVRVFDLQAKLCQEDFILFKSNGSLLTRLFYESTENKIQLSPRQYLEWDPEKNGSNHLPVFAQVTSKIKRPLLLHSDMVTTVIGSIFLLGSAYYVKKNLDRLG